MSKLNENQLHAVKNRVHKLQLSRLTIINAFESPSDLLIIPNGDKYGIYLGDTLVQNVSGSFIEANNVLQGIAQKMRTKREEQRYQIDALKIELKYYLSLMEE